MNVSVGERWEKFVEAIVKDGRYASVSEVVREGLRLVEEREAKLASLRETLQSALDGGGSHTSEDVMAFAEEGLQAWERNNSGRK